MDNKCPKCSGTTEITQGRFRDLTNAKFDTDYVDGTLGMANGVKICCQSCGEINLYLRDWNSLLRKEISGKEISKFQKIYPSFRGVIPLSAWLESNK